MRYKRDLTSRVHVSASVYKTSWVLWDFEIATYVESIYPFKGFWLDLRVGVGPWMLVVYVGE